MGNSNLISQRPSTRVTKFSPQIAIQTICSTLQPNLSSRVVPPTHLSFQILFKKSRRNVQLQMMMKKSTLTMMITTKPMANFAKMYLRGNVGVSKLTITLRHN
jgi:hypothetical protein